MKEYKLRSIIVAPKDMLLVSWDLSQAESWVVAYLANEPNMKESLHGRGPLGNIHSDTAFRLSGLPKDQITKAVRYTYKKSNHAFAYRMSAFRFVQVINKDSDKEPYVVLTNDEGKELYIKWHGYYNLQSWWNEIELELAKSRTLRTPYGRIRVFFDAWGNELFKKATAYVPQSTVADHLNGAVQPETGTKGGLISIYARFKTARDFRIVNQSHDSIIAECSRELVNGGICQEVTSLIRRPLVINDETFTIPVTCEIGERWGELEEVKV